MSATISPAARPRFLDRINPLRALLACLASAMLVSAIPAAAQDAPDGQPAATPAATPARPAAGPATLEVDLATLLTSDEVYADAASDGIWQIAPAPGRRLIQIPLLIKPGQQETTFDQSSLRLRGGQFRAWRLNEQGEQAVVNTWGERQSETPPPEAHPKITRQFTYHPRGYIEWRMDRAIPGATVIESNEIYALKLRSDLLQKQAPTPPSNTSVPVGGGRDARAAAAQAQAELEQFRADSRAYRELREQVREAPTQFKTPVPPRVWAVYEIGSWVNDLELQGAGIQWSIGLQQLEALRNGMAPVNPDFHNGRYLFSSDTRSLIAQMSGVLADNHPYSARTVAYVLQSSGLARLATPGDALYRLIESVLNSGDGDAQEVIMKELVATVPPTAASISLLKQGTRNLGPRIQLEGLRGLVNVDLASNPGQGPEILSQANRLLADPNGPPVAETLATLMEAAAREPDMLALLANGVRFETLPDSRQNEAIVTVVQKAATNPLAAGWLDQRLIGSGSPRVQRQTLELLASADASNQIVGGAVDRAITTVFGKPPAADDKPQRQRIELGGQIPIASPTHSLFRALQQGDPELRALAWEALPRFVFVEREMLTTSSEADPYSALMVVALEQKPTPPQAVDFLARQRDMTRVVPALARIVLQGSERASLQATRALLKLKNAERDALASALLAMSFGDRHGFAVRVYENLTGRAAPMVTFLMRQSTQDNPVVRWFADEIQSGRLPAPREWATAAGGEDRLIDLVTSNDPDLAVGAVSALVWAAGGDDRIVQRETQKLRSLSDLSAANLKKEWAAARKDIYVFRLQRAAGPYRLVLRLGTASPSGFAATQEIDLGIVQLQGTGDSVKLAGEALTLSIPETQMAIRVDNPGELKNFRNEQIAQLPLERVSQPIELLPQPDSSWAGQFDIPEGPSAELVMRPAR